MKSRELANLCSDTIAEVDGLGEAGLGRVANDAALCLAFWRYCGLRLSPADPAGNSASRFKLVVEVWTRNCEIKRLVSGVGGRLHSGVEASDVVHADVRAIFPACEVRELEYPPGPIFR